ncbi:MAG: chemotaxis protein CheW [Proteobacteria bacterium]|nr:chemotaxis protein CheW [Pseudomonadota bacterium]MBU1610616.1 chemotaxis protein CheW [Pseudomonadota bacterium]
MSTIETLNQYLTFVVGKEVFAVNIAAVHEVLELTMITRVPRTPAHMRGVINLRGNAVPVVDMRLKLGMTAQDDTVDTCVIIVELQDETETTLMGAVVDAVQEVFEIDPASIEEPPHYGAVASSDYIVGLCRQQGYFAILIDILRLFSAQELSTARDMNQG